MKITKERLPAWAQKVYAAEQLELQGEELADWFLTLQRGRELGMVDTDGLTRALADLRARIDAVGSMLGRVGAELEARSLAPPVKTGPPRLSVVKEDDWSAPQGAEGVPVPADEDLSKLLPQDCQWAPGAVVPNDADVLVLPAVAVAAVLEFLAQAVPPERMGDAVKAAMKQARGWRPNPDQAGATIKSQPWRDLPSRDPFGIIAANLRRVGILSPEKGPILTDAGTRERV